MLGQRAVSAFFALLFLIVFLRLGQPWFTFFMIAPVAFIAVREFYRMVLSEQPPLLRLFGQVWTLLLVLAPLAGKTYLTPLIITSAVGGSLLLGLFRPGPRALLGWTWNLAGVLYIGWLLSHFTLLMQLDRGTELVVLVLVGTFCCDTAGFFFGRAFGRTRLAPTISPGKTWAGSAAGFLAALAVTVAMGSLLAIDVGLLRLLTLGGLVGVLAQVGDLAESMIKRSAGAKDSGTLMKGHGGLLDRIDSALFAGAGAYYYIILVLL